MSTSCSHLLSHYPCFISPPNSRAGFRSLNLTERSIRRNGISTFNDYSVRWSFPKNVRDGDFVAFSTRVLLQNSSSPCLYKIMSQSNWQISTNANAISNLKKARDAVFIAEPWQVPGTARTVIQA